VYIILIRVTYNFVIIATGIPRLQEFTAVNLQLNVSFYFRMSVFLWRSFRVIDSICNLAVNSLQCLLGGSALTTGLQITVARTHTNHASADRSAHARTAQAHTRAVPVYR